MHPTRFFKMCLEKKTQQGTSLRSPSHFKWHYHELDYCTKKSKVTVVEFNGSSGERLYFVKRFDVELSRNWVHLYFKIIFKMKEVKIVADQSYSGNLIFRSESLFFSYKSSQCGPNNETKSLALTIPKVIKVLLTPFYKMVECKMVKPTVPCKKFVCLPLYEVK